MNFSQLKYIIAVEKQRSFSRAAEECDIAQSTLSKEIQRLEKEFDIIIFDRSRYPVTPTMKGIDLVRQAKIIIEEQETFIHLAQKTENEPTGNFRLGISPIIAPYLLPLFIDAISKKYPKLNIEILELTPKEVEHRFEDNQLDGAIEISHLKKGFYETPLFDEKFVLYVGKNHPLFQKEKVNWSDISIDELLLHQIVKHYLFSSDELIENEIFDLQQFNTINYQSGSLETIRKIIDRNGGITILPHLSTLYMGERRIKMVRPIVNPSITRTVSFVTPRGFEKNRVTKIIKQEILAGLPKE